MKNLTLKTLLEKKLTKAQLAKREKVAKKLEKGDRWAKRYGKKGKAVKLAVATIIAKKKVKGKKKEKTNESYLSEGDVINKDNVPMSRAEIAARNKCYKSKRFTFKKYFKEKRRGGTDTGKERRGRSCTFLVLKSTKKGKGGALKPGAFGTGRKKKAKKKAKKG
jgi:hypothetical protein